MGLGGKEGFWEKRDRGWGGVGGGEGRRWGEEGGGGAEPDSQETAACQHWRCPFYDDGDRCDRYSDSSGASPVVSMHDRQQTRWFAGVDIYTGIGNSINTLGLHVVRCVCGWGVGVGSAVKVVCDSLCHLLTFLFSGCV